MFSLIYTRACVGNNGADCSVRCVLKYDFMSTRLNQVGFRGFSDEYYQTNLASRLFSEFFGGIIHSRAWVRINAGGSWLL